MDTEARMVIARYQGEVDSRRIRLAEWLPLLGPVLITPTVNLLANDWQLTTFQIDVPFDSNVTTTTDLTAPTITPPLNRFSFVTISQPTVIS